MEYLVCSFLVGAGATALIDVWAIARKRLFGISALDYALVGRWFAHLARGRFRHDRIADSASVRGERAIGWIAHYLIGMAFAGALFAIAGLGWIRHPTLGAALAVGLGSVVAPFLVMQPGMGAGIAAHRTARPGAARLQTLITHGIFGLGLYAAGWVMSRSNLFTGG
jgi:hypothetical protein